MENWTGTMQINRVDGEPLLKSGEWQYDPWWNCWKFVCQIVEIMVK